MAEEAQPPVVDRFADAPSIPRAIADAVSHLARCLPTSEQAAPLGRAVNEALAGLQGTAIDEPRSLCSIGPLQSATNSLVEGVQLRAYVRCDQGDLVVEMPLGHARAVVSRILGTRLEGGGSDLVTELERGVFSYLLDPLLIAAAGVLGAAGPREVRALGCETGPLDAGRGEAAALFTGNVTFAGIAAPFRLVVAPGALRAIGESLRASARDNGIADPDWSTLLASAPVDFAAILCRAALPADEIARLQPGDVIVFPDSTVTIDDDANWSGALELVSTASRSGARILVERAAAGDITTTAGELRPSPIALRVTACLPRSVPNTSANDSEGSRVTDTSSRDATADHTSASTVGHDTTAFVHDLPVVVRVELGRVGLTLGQVAALRPGDILELAKDPAEPVALVVEDRVIGRGEIVRVEGELGVRVIELG